MVGCPESTVMPYKESNVDFQDCHLFILIPVSRILVTLSQPGQPTPSPNADFIIAHLKTLITSIKHLSTDIGVFKVLSRNLKLLLSQVSINSGIIVNSVFYLLYITLLT